MSIDIITNEQNPKLPWTFRLPYPGEKKANNEPKEHPNGIKILTQVAFEMDTDHEKTNFESSFKGVENITFSQSNRKHLTLVFDHKTKGKKKEFLELDLTIKY